MNMYYLIEISTQLTDDTLDEDGVVTEVGTKNLAKNALLQLGNQNALPHKKAHLRPNSDGQKIILQVDLAVRLNKNGACNQLADLLPWTSEQISNNSTFTRLGGAEATQEESRLAMLAVLANDKAGWGEEE